MSQTALISQHGNYRDRIIEGQSKPIGEQRVTNGDDMASDMGVDSFVENLATYMSSLRAGLLVLSQRVPLQPCFIELPVSSQRYRGCRRRGGSSIIYSVAEIDQPSCCRRAS